MQTMIQRRDDLFARASSLTEGNPSESDLAQAAGLLDQVDKLNASIQKSDEADIISEQLAVMGSKAYADEDLIGAGVDRGYPSIGTPAGRRAVGDTVARKALQFARSVAGQKAIVAGGTITTPIALTPADPVALGRPAPSLLGVLPTQVITVGAAASYLRQSVRTNAAAPVAVGAVKPTSVYSLESVPVQLQVFAHLSEAVDRFLLEDAPSLSNFLSTELIHGLTLAVEAGVLSGSGTPPAIRGLLNTSGIQTAAWGTDLLVTLRAALTKLQTQGLDASPVFVLSPADWERAETSRAAGGSGTLDLAPTVPVDSAARRIWGVPVVLANGLPTKTGLLIDRTSVLLYADRQGVRVDVGSPGDLWTRNQVQLRCEGRFDLGVLRPIGVVRITTNV